jgi:23S rRNA (cytosine1962-C5)-methyltransferase
MRWPLPAPGERRLAVRATRDAIRQLRGGDPWLYDGSITSVSHEAPAGDLAVVFDDDRKFVAVGLWDPASPIRVKVLQARTPATIDRAWWRSAVAASFERRASLAADPSTTAYRCVHGENDGLPGTVVDRYDATFVLKLYTAALLPHLPALVDAVVTAAGHAERVVLRLSRAVAATDTFGLTDGTTLWGEPPAGPVMFRERALSMEADVVSGQKTGHFLDQRDNRALVRGMAERRDVLDVFASTGGFALAAAAGGARSVHMVDLSAPALATARRNIAHNTGLREVRACSVQSTEGDAFEVLDSIGRRTQRDTDRFDVVVLDPPSFAMNQASVERALRAYAKLTRLGVALLRPGGTLVQASCSSRVTSDQFFDTVHAAASAAGRQLDELRRTGHPLDHPIGFAHGAYLKALFARVPG